MKSFLHFVVEAGGQGAYGMELTSISLHDARAYADAMFKEYQHKSLDEVLPHFNQNFSDAQALAHQGFARREDMPVIDNKDVKDFQRRLENGNFDVRAPFAPATEANPFPQGISSDAVRRFVDLGLPKFDGAPLSDDRVRCSQESIAANRLFPIQKQIYLDKCIDIAAKFGLERTKDIMMSTTLICSQDNRIIDGHHRWMGAVLLDPNMHLPCLKIDLPIKILLPLALSFSDAQGNPRNA